MLTNEGHRSKLTGYSQINRNPKSSLSPLCKGGVGGFSKGGTSASAGAGSSITLIGHPVARFGEYQVYTMNMVERLVWSPSTGLRINLVEVRT